MGTKVRIPYLLFALLVAAFIAFYPQLDAAGYCDGGACPEVSYSAHGAAGTGVSFVVAALVVVSGVLFARASRSTLVSHSADALLSITLPPAVPPPQPSA